MKKRNWSPTPWRRRSASIRKSWSPSSKAPSSVPTDLFLDFAIVLRFDAIELLKSVALEPDAAPRPAAEKPGYEPELVALLRDFTRIRDPDIRSQVLSLVALAARESEKDGK